MVVIANNDKPPDLSSKVYEYTKNYDFSLSNWQLWSIESILNQNDVLICAPTGSGKTLPAEFAIQYFVQQKKKVIYTSPIKALSNYMKENFQIKFPNITFGIVTGDNKDNPDADCIICTTECLRNYLFSNQEQSTDLNFDIQIEKEVGIIIYDEAHYFNDPDRGSVWESCFIKHKNLQIPKLLMSATLHQPEIFAEWLENNTCAPEKQVYLCQTNIRAVPLEHYMYITSHPSFSTKMTDKKLISSIQNTISKPILLKKGNEFQDFDYQNVKSVLNTLSKQKVFVKRQFVLNDIVRFLKQNDKLPAILFVYSRKGVEVMANEITQNLHEDATFPSLVEKEAENILRTKLPNYKEYTQLSEYRFLIHLLEKGIAIHHAGMIQILRELVEKMFSKGYVKLLVATETFAVGINLPCKTTLFPNVVKWDGSSNRILKGHEYIQQAGRAGRRGFDVKGEAFHLLNLFSELPSSTEYTSMLQGKPQLMVSKFKISYELILNIIMTSGISNINQLLDFANSSMITTEINKELNYYKKIKEDLIKELEPKNESLKYISTSESLFIEYKEAVNKLPFTKKKAKKALERQIENLKSEKGFERDLQLLESIEDLKSQIKKNDICIQNTEEYVQYNINKVFEILCNENFINYSSHTISEKGILAHGIKEVHSLAFADSLIKNEFLKDFSDIDIILYFSIFTNIHVKEDYKSFNSKSSILVDSIISFTKSRIEYYQDKEHSLEIYTGTPFSIHYDLIPYLKEWCQCSSEKECKIIIDKMNYEKEIFLGDFVKAILKINNIAQELDSICNIITNKQDLQVKLKNIPLLTMKYVVTNNSLYI